MMSIFKTWAGKLMSVLAKSSEVTAENAKSQQELNKTEVEGAPVSLLRLWRGFLGWVLAITFAWEVIGRSVMTTYFPEIKLPPSVLDEISTLLIGMLGLGF